MLFDKNASSVIENGKKISMLSLALPLFFESIFLLLYGTVNTVILSDYSDLAVSAVSVCVQISNIAVGLVQMLIKGTVIILSVSLGSKNYFRASKTASNGLVAVVLLGFALSMVMFFCAGSFCSFMGLEGNAKSLAVDYLKVYSLFFVVLCVYSLFNNLLICNGYSKYSMVIGIMCNVINAVMLYFYLYRPIFNGFSKIKGIAIIGAIAQTVGLIVSLLIFIIKKCPFKFSCELKSIINICKFGVPAGISVLSYALSQTVTTSFIVSLGLTVLNAKIYISNIICYVSKGSLAIGQAGAVLFGRYKGAKQYNKTIALFKQNIFCAVSLNLIFSFICLAFYKPLLRMFTDDEKLIKSVFIIFLIDILVEIFRAINHVSENALNANGDVKFTFVVSVISCWVFCVLLSYLFGVKLGFGLVGIWIAFVSDEVFRAILYLVRLKLGKWKNIKI